MQAIRKFSGKNSFLSNFFHCPFVYNDIRFPTAEHAFQWSKAADQPVRVAIAHAATPAEAKYLGRHCKLRPDWHDVQVRIRIMEGILLKKFCRATKLDELLLNTGAAYLEEGNTHGDILWGTVKGKGENLLGLTLMRVRRQVRADRIWQASLEMTEIDQMTLHARAESLAMEVAGNLDQQQPILAEFLRQKYDSRQAK